MIKQQNFTAKSPKSLLKRLGRLWVRQLAIWKIVLFWGNMSLILLACSKLVWAEMPHERASNDPQNSSIRSDFTQTLASPSTTLSKTYDDLTLLQETLDQIQSLQAPSAQNEYFGPDLSNSKNKLFHENIDALTLNRLNQAQELLGKFFQKVPFARRNKQQLKNSLAQIWQTNLPATYKKKSKNLAQKTLEIATRFGLDPIFILSVVATESSFNPKAKGSMGEIGLMQLMPETARWLAKKLGWKKFKASQLNDPEKNLILGAFYFSQLRLNFRKHGRLYVAAYNMGPGKLRELMSHKKWPQEYPKRIMDHYLDFSQKI